MSLDKIINRQFLIILLFVLILAASACGETTPEADLLPTQPEEVPTLPKPTATQVRQFRILFIGNSLTYWNEGLAHHLKLLVDSAELPLAFTADQVYQLGAPLQTMWEESAAREMIAEGEYDWVVLQDGLPSSDVETFHEYIRKFTTEIRDSGADPILFMTWARSGISSEEIAQAYGDIAKELGLDVAPVGIAWQLVIEEEPGLDLFDPDKVHPNIAGTYLSVNIIFAAIFGESPQGLDYLPDELIGEQATYLQRIAWETVGAYRLQQ